MLETLASLLSIGTILLAAYGLGRPIVRALGPDGMDELTAAVWSLAVGLIAAGAALAALGLVGVLYTPLVVVVSLAAGFWGVGEIARGYLHGFEHPPADAMSPAWEEAPSPPFAPPARWLCRGLLLLAAAACVGSLVGALAPPTAGDALCYHLDLPKRFLAERALCCPPYNDNATFPLLVEMWYLWGLALRGPVAAQLVHWALGILLALAAVVLARPILGGAWAWIVGAVVLLAPGVNNQMTAPLNDLGLAAMATLALAAWWRATVGQEGRRWFILAGLAGGGAMGTKYLALVFALAVAATWLYALGRHPGRRRLLLEGAAVVSVIAVSVGGLWYVRAAWHRGNPVYPFLSELQSGDPDADAPETLPESKAPLGRGLPGMAVAAWQVTMHPERFGGRGHQLGVLFLAALPGLCFARRLRGLGTLLSVAAVYGVLWYLLRQNVRFLFPIIPPASVAVVWVWIEIRRFPPTARRAATAIQAAVVVVFALVALGRSHDRLAVAVGLEDRPTYLSRREPSFAAATVANLILEPDAHILSQDNRLFYFDSRITRESIYRRTTHYDRRIAAPSDLGRVLREAGFTHLLLVENVGPRGVRFDPTLARLADADGSLTPLSQSFVADADGGRRHYRLVALRGGTP